MRVTKKDKINNEKLRETSSLLKAIAHPLRISILHLLSINKNLSVTEIHKKLKIEQAVASHHLAKLKSKNLVQIKREGKNVFYFIGNSKVNSFLTAIDKLLK